MRWCSWCQGFQLRDDDQGVQGGGRGSAGMASLLWDSQCVVIWETKSLEAMYVTGWFGSSVTRLRKSL